MTILSNSANIFLLQIVKNEKEFYPLAWFWLVLLILGIIFAVVSKKNIAIPPIPSALVSAVLAFINIDIIIQVALFVVLTVILYAIYFFIAKKTSTQVSQYSPDSLVGERCVVVEKVDNFAGCGLVRVGKQFWSARGAYDDDVFEAGENLTVVAIEGVKLICRKV